MAFAAFDTYSEYMKTVRPQLRYMPEEDPHTWQERARAKLREILGVPASCEVSAINVEWTHEQKDHTETRFTFTSEPGADVVCHLLMPKKDKLESMPLAICVQGHSTGMHISLGRAKFEGDREDIEDGDRDFARQALRRGFAALALEQRAFGERGAKEDGTPNCRQSAMAALLMGRTLIGDRCLDVSRAIDAVESNFPEIDTSRIAMMGNSGGGTTTIYAAALDTRIMAAMPSCALCGYYASIGAMEHCFCNYVPGIMNWFDMGDIAALIAPRPLIVVNGATDVSFPLPSAVEQVKIASRLYNRMGAGDKLRHVIGPEGHRFYAALAWPEFASATGWIE